MSAWFENDPQRYETEIHELEAAGVTVQEDETVRAQGILRLSLHISGDNPFFDLPAATPDLHLVAVFPFTYPFFRPIVFVESELTLPRHFNPVNRNFCLLGRSTGEWEPQTTLASHLQSQLKKVLEKGSVTDPALLVLDPTEQPEPESEYYETSSPPVLFNPQSFEQDLREAPVFRMLGKIRVGFAEQKDGPLQMVVLGQDKSAGVISATMPTGIYQQFPATTIGMVYRLPCAPPYDPAEAFIWLKAQAAASGQEKIQYSGNDLRLKSGDIIQYVFALNFREEGSSFEKEYTGWLFLVVVRVKQPIAGKSNQKKWENRVFWARISRVDPETFGIRIPKLKPLREKSIAIFGLGALGAPSAIEFARNGVKELRLLDFDIVDAGTTVRWALGMSAAGTYKTITLKQFIEANYPFTKVVIENIRIGELPVLKEGLPSHDLVREPEVLERMLTDVSLVYDATAETGIMHFLSYHTRLRQIPYISVSATEGALGGRVVRVVPGKTEGCWMCSQWHEMDGNIPAPPADSTGKIQPVGCGDFTFTGASFDLQNVSLAGVRLAVSTLCKGNPNAYPAVNWDVGILHLVDEQRQPVLPRWDQLPLRIHVNCPYCNHHE